MKTVLYTALVAAVLTAGAASAMTEPSNQLVAQAQNKLDAYGFNVDAATLTGNQLAGIHFVDSEGDSAVSAVRSQIESVLKR